MFKIKIAPVLRKLAAVQGVTVPTSGTINPKKSLFQLSATLKAKGAVHAFVVPPIGISPATALSAAAKVLSQGKKSESVISHSRALAALGDKDAARGLSALMTARAMQAKGTKIPPPPPRVLPIAFKKTYTSAEVAAMAQTKSVNLPVATEGTPKTVIPVKLSVWVRVKRWVGRHI